MTKIDLILRKDEFTSFTSYYLEPLWQEFFDIKIYDSKNTYDKKRSLFVVWWTAADDSWTQDMKNHGYKIVVDNLWERATGRSDYYWLENPKWWWWNESLWWRALGFNSYRPRKKNQYLALMTLRRFDPARVLIIDRLTDLLPNMLYSCAWLDKTLPNDTCDSQQGTRHMHPDWYDQTWCSVVVEASVSDSQPPFVTEKSYKPLAYHHPFVSASSPGTLHRLRSQGFETFDNLFDESYDIVTDFTRRLEIIVSNLESIKISDHYDTETRAKIQHNHQKFFCESTCRAGITQEIIQPLLEYAET